MGVHSNPFAHVHSKVGLVLLYLERESKPAESHKSEARKKIMSILHGNENNYYTLTAFSFITWLFRRIAKRWRFVDVDAHSSFPLSLLLRYCSV